MKKAQATKKTKSPPDLASYRRQMFKKRYPSGEDLGQRKMLSWTGVQDFKAEHRAKVASLVLELLAHGKSMREICSMDGMPNRTTVNYWALNDVDFAAKLMLARELQGDYMVDLVMDTAKNCVEDNSKAASVKIGAYQWAAEKLNPKYATKAINLDNRNQNVNLGLSKEEYEEVATKLLAGI